jgi:hypothetical protein
MDPIPPISTPKLSSMAQAFAPYLLTSSPPEPIALRATNQAFLSTISCSNLNAEFKAHVQQLSNLTERLQTDVTILEKELEVWTIHIKRKERAAGKRIVLKGKTVISTEGIQKALEEAEQATRSKKQKKPKLRRRKVRSQGGKESSDLGDEIEVLAINNDYLNVCLERERYLTVLR